MFKVVGGLLELRGVLGEGEEGGVGVGEEGGGEIGGGLHPGADGGEIGRESRASLRKSQKRRKCANWGDCMGAMCKLKRTTDTRERNHA